MAGDGVQMDRRIGRAADSGIDDDGVFERLARHDVGGFDILMHHFDDALASQIRDLAAFAVRRRNGGAARQHHAERLGHGVHRRCRAHGVAEARRWRRRGDDVDILVPVDFAGRLQLLGFPFDGARTGTPALVPAVEHRPDGERDRRNIDRRRRHQAGRRGLVATDRQHHAVDRIAEQGLHQPQISQIAVKRRGWPLAGFLDRMNRKLKGDAAGLANALAHALG